MTNVGVIGYDDVLISMYATPSLTTIRQDVARGARTMVDLLFQRMEGNAVSSVVMKPELILRNSA